VKRILKRDKRVEGVYLDNGETVIGDYVVSNMEVIPAYRELQDESGGMMLKKYEYLYEPAASGLVVHLGLNRRYPQFAHHNFVFSRDPKKHFDTIHRRKQMPEDPTIYLVCPTRTDPSVAPEGHEIIKLLPHIPYLQNPPFAPEEYMALKERLFDKLERIGCEDLRKHIVTEDVMTPHDIHSRYYSNKGSIYGVVSNRKRNFALKAPKQSEKYDNLYFVGGSVNPGGGTPMVVLSGQIVADRIAKRYR
jgi:diapolycopene oxygenase